MKSFQHQIVLFVTVLLVAMSSYAEKIDLPFGIREYNIDKAPDLILQNLDGETFDLKDARGHWVFLHFWASWCGPCRREMPMIQKLATTFNEGQLQIVMVNTAEDEDTIFTFMASINMEASSLMDKDGQASEVWKPRGLPTTFLIDPDGNVRYQAIGGRDWINPEYVKFLKKLVE